jgi:hypothetical protein
MGLRSFFRKQQVDEIGFHAVKLQKLLLILIVVEILLAIFGAGLGVLLTVLLLGIGFYGAAKRKTCLLRIYSCCTILGFVLTFLAIIAGIVMFSHWRSTFCGEIGAPENVTTNIYNVWDPIDMATPTPRTSVTPAFRIFRAHFEAGKHEDDDDDEHHRKPHPHGTKPTKHEDSDEEPAFCWEYQESPHCEREYNGKSFMGQCIGGKFYWAGHVSFGALLAFTFLTSFVMTLKLASAVLASRLACKIKCNSYRMMQVQEETYPAQGGYYMPVPFEPQPTPMYAEQPAISQVEADEMLAHHLQRQYDME